MNRTTPEILARAYQSSPRTVRRYLHRHFPGGAQPDGAWLLTRNELLQVGYALHPMEAQSRRGSMVVRK
jgi:hypothetical protein